MITAMDVEKTFANVLTFLICVMFLASIHVLSGREYVFKPNATKEIEEQDPEEEQEEEEEQEQEQEQEQEEKPTPLTRMCRFGCCPLNQTMDAYYESFTDEAIYHRKAYVDSMYEDVERDYMEAKKNFSDAQVQLNQAHAAYVHLITSSEKMASLDKERSMQAKLADATVEDMYGMLSAVHKWKPFVHSPNGMYPEEKVMWEKVLWNQIRRAKEHQT
uniref:Uncharacterized protein n=1 Tax=viral metagenome TaxID=1070528 RepID=A0A6C0LAL7_9ZZZZ